MFLRWRTFRGDVYEGPGSGRPLVLILGRQVEFRDLSNQELWGAGGSTRHTWASPGVQRPILCSAVPHAGTSAWLCRGLGRGWPPILCAPALSHQWTSDARSAGSCERTVSATLAPRQKGRLVSPREVRSSIPRTFTEDWGLDAQEEATVDPEPRSNSGEEGPLRWPQ